MAHARQQVREAVAALLATTPTNWTAVLQTRLVPARQVWPLLQVYATEESSEQLLIHPAGVYDRSLSLAVVGLLKMPGAGNGTGESETVEDRMDAMSSEIETRITNAALTAALNKVKSAALTSTEMEIVVNEDDGSVSHAVLTQTWTITYDTAEGAPDTLI